MHTGVENAAEGQLPESRIEAMVNLYQTIIPWAYNGWQITNKASLAKIISYPTIGSGIIGLLKMPQNRDISSQLYFVRTKGL